MNTPDMKIDFVCKSKQAYFNGKGIGISPLDIMDTCDTIAHRFAIRCAYIRKLRDNFSTNLTDKKRKDISKICLTEMMLLKEVLKQIYCSWYAQEAFHSNKDKAESFFVKILKLYQNVNTLLESLNSASLTKLVLMNTSSKDDFQSYADVLKIDILVVLHESECVSAKVN